MDFGRDDLRRAKTPNAWCARWPKRLPRVPIHAPATSDRRLMTDDQRLTTMPRRRRRRRDRGAPADHAKAGRRTPRGVLGIPRRQSATRTNRCGSAWARELLEELGRAVARRRRNLRDGACLSWSARSSCIFFRCELLGEPRPSAWAGNALGAAARNWRRWSFRPPTPS